MRLYNYLTEQTNKKELVILIGLPASGKSTYIKKNYPKHIIVSNDHFVEKQAKKDDTDYTTAYNKIGRSKLIELGKKDFQKALKTNRSIVLDNTNLTKEIRKQYLDLANNYKKIAIVFKISGKEQEKRLTQRKGKDIPTDVLNKMKQDYQAPSKSEGFEEIIKA